MEKLGLLLFILTLISSAYAAEICPSPVDILTKARGVGGIEYIKEHLGYKVVYSSILRNSYNESKLLPVSIDVKNSISKLSSSSQSRYSNKVCCYDMYVRPSHQPFAELCLGK